MNINTDRSCENCGREWRGSPDCPVCGYEEPYAVFAYRWPLGDVTLEMYRIHGGERDRSDVSLETVQELGIEVRA